MSDTKTQASESGFYFIGNNLSVDFVNTCVNKGDQIVDLLQSLEDFALWARAAGLIGNLRAAWLPQKSGDATSGADVQEKLRIEDVHRFRTDLQNLFHAAQNEIPIEPAQLENINKVLRRQKGFTELAVADAGFVKRFRQNFDSPLQIFIPIAETAVDLLCYGDLTRLKKCAAPNCLLQFYDTTKNRTRRWCSDKACGNRARATAFYRRRKN